MIELSNMTFLEGAVLLYYVVTSFLVGTVAHSYLVLENFKHFKYSKASITLTAVLAGILAPAMVVVVFWEMACSFQRRIQAIRK